LPLNARNVIGLLSLQPGVTRTGEVNGTRRDQSNILLDGIDNNEQQSGLDIVSSLTTQVPGYAGDAFGSVLRVTPDSVQEFRVTTSNPNADQGRSSGAQVSLVTKSGTNEFHGALYEYHRNTVTTANDFFNNSIGRYTQGVPEYEDIVNQGQANFGELKEPRPKLIRNIFGGSLGGPIIKNRLYFFYNYEGRRDAEAQSVLQTVPTATLREGTVRYFNTSGGITTVTPAQIAALYPDTGGVNPAGLALLRTAPLPNDFTTGDGLNTAGFRFNAPISSELNVHIARFDLTLTYGLRWGVGTPVYEAEGFQTAPTVSLSDFFRRRQEGATAGQPLNELLTINLSGRANGGRDFYETDWNNFAPNVSVAWSPDFGNNFFGRLFGRQGRSVLRGGFRMLYDRVGSGLAVGFDLNNALGFSSSNTVGPNTVDTTANLGPLFGGLGQNIRSFPYIIVPGALSFPLSQPADSSLRIEQTLDDALTTPRQYSFNLTYGRELPKGLSFEASYIGRLGRNLLVERDIMQFNNLRDPKSGMTWYQAANILAQWRFADVPFSQISNIPYFENLFPNFGADFFGDPTLSTTQALYLIHGSANQGGFDYPDFTGIQTFLQDGTLSTVGPYPFYHPQYGTLSVLSSIGSSDYHGMTLSLRHRFRSSVFVDVNYTFAKSLDNGSPIEAEAQLGGNLTRNSFDLNLSKSFSDFDVRHNFNANWLVELPFGKGRRFASGMPKVIDALLGGWQLTGIFRWHSGLPAGTPGDVGFWNTNWQITNYGVRLRDINTCQSDVDGSPNIFCNPTDAYRSFRNSRAGEVGDRNVFRLPIYIVLDSGLSKTFKMWYSENHRIQFRWEVFNVTNTQRFGTLSNFSLNQNPNEGSPDLDFGRYVGSQTPIGENRPGRVMQFALRYTF
jgi:hypothetical protein